MGIVVDLYSPDWGCNPMGIIQSRIALCGVLPCRGPGYVRLLRTQPHSCCRGRNVWPCGRILHRPGYVCLLRTQPHSCHRGRTVWPCGRILHRTYASYVPNLTAVAVWPCGRILHQWLTVATLHSMLYVGADSAGPPHTQALGEWPLRHYQTFIPQ